MEGLTANRADDGTIHDEDYTEFLHDMQLRFMKEVDNGNIPVFTTDATGLWEAYLAAWPSDERQHHNCNCCQKFIESVGNLVTINAEGEIKSAFWSLGYTPEHYKAPVRAVMRLVKDAAVTGIYYGENSTVGNPVTGKWQHMHLKMPRQFVNADFYPAIASKIEDVKNVKRALTEYPIAVVNTAYKLLNGDELFRAEKVLGPAKFLRDLHNAVKGKRGPVLHNIVSLHVATAPDGFCHPRSSMIGTLLDDLAAGNSINSVRARFAAKMDPSKYMHATEAPSEGTVVQAEKLVAKHGLEPSFWRRQARLDEVKTFWQPKSRATKKTTAKGGMFGDLETKNKRSETPVDVARVPLTELSWAKFERTVLPTAVEITLDVSRISTKLPMFTMTTAVNADAPPIIQWDDEDVRNPFGWYVNLNGNPPSEYGLDHRKPWKALALVKQPSMWQPGFQHQGESIFIVIEGARELEGADTMCLFPEIMRNDLHGIRSVVSAFSDNNRLANSEGQLAAGFRIDGNIKHYPVILVVRDDGGTTMQYRIDRLE